MVAGAISAVDAFGPRGWRPCRQADADAGPSGTSVGHHGPHDSPGSRLGHFPEVAAWGTRQTCRLPAMELAAGTAAPRAQSLLPPGRDGSAPLHNTGCGRPTLPTLRCTCQTRHVTCGMWANAGADEALIMRNVTGSSTCLRTCTHGSCASHHF